MEENSIQLSPHKLKKFVRHLCLAAKTIEERDMAKEHLSQHLDNLKKLASSKAKHKTISKGLKELEQHIENTIEKEKRATKIRPNEPFHQEMLKKKIDELNAKFDMMNEALTERQQKIASIEKKINTKVDQKQKQVQEIQDMIEKLEEKYKDMAKSSNVAIAAKVQEKIQLLKSKLKKIIL